MTEHDWWPRTKARLQAPIPGTSTEPRGKEFKVFLTVFLVVLSPFWIGGALIVLWIVAMIVLAPVDAVHRDHFGDSFSPGRWEARGGEYYVELGAPGEESSFRLPFDPSSFCNSEADAFESEITYEIVGFNGQPGESMVGVTLVDPPNPQRDAGPFLVAGGLFSNGYDWYQLEYSACDPDLVDVTLTRVDPDVERE